MIDLIQSLKNIGLNEKEAKIYLALLQAGKATAYQVAKNSGLKRPTVYVILEELVNKGAVGKVPKEKVTHYRGVSPEDLFAMAEHKLLNAKESLPELKALGRARKKHVSVSYYEGLDGMKEMYEKLCKTMVGREYVGFGAQAKDEPPEVLEYFDELNKIHKKLDIRRRGITVKHSSVAKCFKKEWQKKYKVKIKALPMSEYDSNISMEIYKNFVQIISHRYMQGVLIENPDIAKVMKQLFEFVWKRTDET